MKREKWLIYVGIFAPMLTVGVCGEVHRFSMSEITASIGDMHEGANGELRRWSLSAQEVSDKLPEMLRIVFTDGADAEASTVTAVLAVKSGEAEIRESIEVEMELVGHSSYGISPASVAPLREWLASKFFDLMRGNLALESIDGLNESFAFQLGTSSAIADRLQHDGIVEGLDRIERTLVGYQNLAGRPLGKVEFVDMDGETRRFSDFRGRVVLLHVWATWCGPCVAAMSGLEALEDRYRDRGFSVVNLSDESADVIQDWLVMNPTDMVHGRVNDFAFLASETDAEEDGMFRVRPVYVILDRQGYAQAHRVGGGEIRMKIVSGPDGENRSITTHTDYLSEWVLPHF